MKLAVFASLLMIVSFQAVAGSCIGKNVEVWLGDGYSLPGDDIGSPEPYVKVKIGKTIRQNKGRYSTDSPSWWEKFEFPNATSGEMKIEVWEYDRMSEDDHLGTCKKKLVSGDKNFRPIQCSVGNSGGYVRLFYRCL